MRTNLLLNISSNDNNNVINLRNVSRNLKKVGLLNPSSRTRSQHLGGTLITKRPYNHGKMLGSGAQGSVYEHKSNKNKVVKLRTFKPEQEFKLNNDMTRKLNKHYLGELNKINNVIINKHTAGLMKRYPSYFLEAFLQHKAGKANIGAKVHEIFATEDKSSNNSSIKVHIYIVMNKLQNTNSTNQERRNLANQAGRHGIVYQNGSKAWQPKSNHIMQTKNGKKVLINFGNSRYLTNAEFIEQRAKSRFGTIIKATGHNSLTING